MPGPRAGTPVLVLFLCAAMAGSSAGESPSTTDPQGVGTRFEAWLDAGHRDAVAAYRADLERRGLHDVMPMAALLRTSRSWQGCRHDEFSTPPRALWPSIAGTLRLVRRLDEAGLIDPASARSVYRAPEVNQCARGAAQSRHLRNNAIDFDLPDRPGNVEALCAWWRSHGPKAGMGLGFYSATTIHIDTAGFRTWGTDHSRRTSLCASRG